MNPILGATSAGDPLSLDVERLIGSHACIVANAGGGKSGLIRRLLEVTHGLIQHIVLDVEDEYYTLREHFDYVIAGGDGGDAPATVESAEGLALATLQHGFSLIVQLNDLGPVNAPRFVGRFLEALIAAPRALWRPVLVVLDEAQRFAPSGGASTAATQGVHSLTSQGRKRGFTAVLASQRIVKIDPDVRGDINNWLLGRVGQSIDRNTMADALGFTNKEGQSRFRGLEPRHFWAFGPALEEEPTLFRVSDVETTPVRPGQAKVPTPPPPEALRAILQGLATAEVPADREAPASGSSPSNEGAKAEAAGLSDLRGRLARSEADKVRLVDELEATVGAMERLTAVATELKRRHDAARLALDTDDLEIPAQSGGAPAPPPRRERATPPKAMPYAPEGRAEGGVVPGAAGDMPALSRKMIDTLARFHPRALPIEHIAKIAGVSMKSSQWNANRRGFVESGLVEPFINSQWRISERGVAELALMPVPDSPAALLQFWISSVSPSTGSMLREIVAAQGEPLTREEIAIRAGVSLTSSGLNGGLRELRDHDLITQENGFYRASEVLL